MLKNEFIEVSITPGAIALTLIFEGAISFAKAFVKRFIPPFDVEYKTSQEAPTSPHIEDILSITPFLLIIWGIAIFDKYNGPKRFVFKIFSISSLEESINNPIVLLAALLTKISIFPKDFKVKSIIFSAPLKEDTSSFIL